MCVCAGMSQDWGRGVEREPDEGVESGGGGKKRPDRAENDDNTVMDGFTHTIQ